MEEDIYITHPAIEKYLDGLLPEREPWFFEMERMAEEKNFPAVGPQVGLLLEILARSIGAKRILELGSGFGYSGLWFSRALPADGFIVLSDFEEANRKLAEGYFRQAGKAHMMEFRVGDALGLLEQQVEGYFDIVFNDIDKEFYPAVIEPVYRVLRKGGLFIADNTLWDGKVAHSKRDQVAQSVHEFNCRLKEHVGFSTIQLPLRDGVSVSIKK